MRIKRPRLVDVQDPKRLRDLLDAVIELVNRATNLHVGPGLQMQQTPGGVGIALAPQKSARRGGGAAEDCSGGELQTISCTMGTQDTDTWASTSEDPVKVSLITDISWDAVNGIIVGRLRDCTFDKCGNLKSIGSEGDLVPLITTESCAP